MAAVDPCRSKTQSGLITWRDACVVWFRHSGQTVMHWGKRLKEGAPLLTARHSHHERNGLPAALEGQSTLRLGDQISRDYPTALLQPESWRRCSRRKWAARSHFKIDPLCLVGYQNGGQFHRPVNWLHFLSVAAHSMHSFISSLFISFWVDLFVSSARLRSFGSICPLQLLL